MVKTRIICCPRAEPRNGTYATTRAMTRAMGPCMVPTSRAKTRDACQHPCLYTCHGALPGAREPSQDTWCAPRGLAWSSRVEPWHATRATAPAMTRATGPCMVPTSRAKTRDAFHCSCHDACHGALHGAHEPSQDTGRMPRGLAWCPRAELRHETRATACAMTCATGPCIVPASQPKTRYPCHGALLGAHEPSQDTWRVSPPVPWQLQWPSTWC